jgi:predicted LPLAT superfamily acyltransferase
LNRATKQAWIESPEGGGRLSLKIALFVARVCGRVVTRGILYVTSLYYMVRRDADRRASRAYLTRALNRPASLWQVLKHIHCFATVTLDRIYLLLERFNRFDVQCHGLEKLRATVALNRGVLLYGSHLGSFDALRTLTLKRSDMTFRTVIDVAQNPMLTEMLNTLNSNLATTIINARQDGTNTAFAIKDALDSGAVVAMLVDRARPGNTVTTIDFLGAPAPFPAGPWLLAATLKVPVVLCFGLYGGSNRYDLYFEPFADKLEIPRRDRQTALQSIIRRYADRLEYYARLSPYNWFNFYDFWQPQATVPPDDGDAAGSLDNVESGTGKDADHPRPK